MQWEIRSKKVPRSLEELKEVWLENRRLETGEAREEFFGLREIDKITSEEVGLSREEIEKARARLERAREKKERVVIYGDYDVDGNCATAVAWLSLREWGLETKPFIPDRKKHGYGLTQKSLKAIDEMIEKGEKPDLIVTVDNGIVAFAAAEELAKKGIDLIITDHHQPEEERGLPRAVAVVASTEICGAGVAWFFLREVTEKIGPQTIANERVSEEIEVTSSSGGTLLPTRMSAKRSADFSLELVAHDKNHSTLQKSNLTISSLQKTSAANNSDSTIFSESYMNKLLDLVGMATVADQMRVVGVNRQLIKHGLKKLQTDAQIGIKKLAANAGIDLAKLTKEGIDYGLAPRLNALGRLEGGMDTLRLLCTKSETQANKLAMKIELTNHERRELTEIMWQEVQEQAREQMEQKRKVLIIESENFHEGIIGLLASKAVESWQRPAIILAVGGETSVASARSLGGIDITELMRAASEKMLSVGGHTLAGGGAMKNEERENFKKMVWEKAEREITEEDLEEKLRIENEVGSEVLTDGMVELLEEMAPFGQGNREPIVMVKKLRLININPIGKEGNHWQTWWWNREREQRLKIMAWQADKKWRREDWELEREYEIVVRPSINEWRGKKTLQMELVAGKVT